MSGIEGGVPGFEPAVRYNNLGDYGIDFSVILRTREVAGQYLILHEFVKLVHSRYRDEGIGIPYPTTVLRVPDGWSRMVRFRRWEGPWAIFSPMEDGFDRRLREAVSRPLPNWREVYERFSPRDLETGKRRPRVPPAGARVREAAVLIPVVRGEKRIIYTLRKEGLRNHAGQISFPGGRFEPRDSSLMETALRESHEEVLLDPSRVEVLGRLEKMYIPASGFLVSPYVGLLPKGAEYSLSSPGEVQEVFTVPLEVLMAPETFREIVWRRDGREYEVPVFSVGDHNIWGATAAMTAGLLVRLGWKPD
ncbi:NUDIX domain-containing protein [Rubrobacter calidifluminis]|uniref:NUDIX domain-containing protein n=1 Tax=Rubrobacter calidifluminis TaxID=1392640 RepID=UPI00235EC008|nr:NUDIX domain-containing protein [Rubrobacter calidifluminis]